MNDRYTLYRVFGLLAVMCGTHTNVLTAKMQRASLPKMLQGGAVINAADQKAMDAGMTHLRRKMRKTGSKSNVVQARHADGTQPVRSVGPKRFKRGVPLQVRATVSETDRRPRISDFKPQPTEWETPRPAQAIQAPAILPAALFVQRTQPASPARSAAQEGWQEEEGSVHGGGHLDFDAANTSMDSQAHPMEDDTTWQDLTFNGMHLSVDDMHGTTLLQTPPASMMAKVPDTLSVRAARARAPHLLSAHTDASQAPITPCVGHHEEMAASGRMLSAPSSVAARALRAQNQHLWGMQQAQVQMQPAPPVFATPASMTPYAGHALALDASQAMLSPPDSVQLRALQAQRAHLMQQHTHSPQEARQAQAQQHQMQKVQQHHQQLPYSSLAAPVEPAAASPLGMPQTPPGAGTCGSESPMTLTSPIAQASDGPSLPGTPAPWMQRWGRDRRASSTSHFAQRPSVPGQSAGAARASALASPQEGAALMASTPANGHSASASGTAATIIRPPEIFRQPDPRPSDDDCEMDESAELAALLRAGGVGSDSSAMQHDQWAQHSPVPPSPVLIRPPSADSLNVTLDLPATDSLVVLEGSVEERAHDALAKASAAPAAPGGNGQGGHGGHRRSYSDDGDATWLLDDHNDTAGGFGDATLAEGDEMMMDPDRANASMDVLGGRARRPMAPMATGSPKAAGGNALVTSPIPSPQPAAPMTHPSPQKHLLHLHQAGDGSQGLKNLALNPPASGGAKSPVVRRTDGTTDASHSGDDGESDESLLDDTNRAANVAGGPSQSKLRQRVLELYLERSSDEDNDSSEDAGSDTGGANDRSRMGEAEKHLRRQRRSQGVDASHLLRANQHGGDDGATWGAWDDEDEGAHAAGGKAAAEANEPRITSTWVSDPHYIGGQREVRTINGKQEHGPRWEDGSMDGPSQKPVAPASPAPPAASSAVPPDSSPGRPGSTWGAGGNPLFGLGGGGGDVFGMP